MAHITIIVPNYNHAPYLRKRMETILAQTYTDWEAIILDDASTDDSRGILEEYRSHPKIRHLIFNENNSGSAFCQWNRGFALTTGEFIWVAESDDYADSDFLTRLVVEMERHPSAGIAYAQSYRVNSEGVVQGTNLEYTDIWDTERWKRDFFVKGTEECATALFQFNPIPNASAVLLRRSVVEAVGRAKEEMRLCGDYLLYVEMLMQSDLVFVAEPLNYYRFHAKTVRSGTYFNGTFVREVYQIQQRILQEVTVEQSLKEKVFEGQVRHWSQTIYSKVPLAIHKEIYKVARKTDPNLHKRWLHFVFRAISNRFMGKVGK